MYSLQIKTVLRRDIPKSIVLSHILQKNKGSKVDRVNKTLIYTKYTYIYVFYYYFQQVLLM
jgi:hypothetical protein